VDYQILFDEHVFLVSGHDGDVPAGENGGLGLYHEDTRHLSELELRINGEPLILLGSTDEDIYKTTVLLTNGDLREGGRLMHRGSISLLRTRGVSGAVHERTVVKNYDRSVLNFELTLGVGADFADIFELRGFLHGRSGQTRAPRQREGSVLFSYLGGDGVTRSTEVAYSVAPDKVSSSSASSDPGDRAAPVRALFTWGMELTPQEERTLELSYTPRTGKDQNERRLLAYEAETHRLNRSYSGWAAGSTVVESDNDDFNALLERSALDLRALAVSYPTGRMPIAGIPWFAVPFGRDSLITSLQTLCFRPELAVGTLRFLATYQGTKNDPWRDEEPGKIMHELRSGELTGLGVTPHSPYYGSVDSTPLFVMLFAQALR
jgi:glycogen debranching enzyme